jgi:hypothetical protein
MPNFTFLIVGESLIVRSQDAGFVWANKTEEELNTTSGSRYLIAGK